MESERPPSIDKSFAWSTLAAWLGWLAVLLAWQGWLTLGLFGGWGGWETLTNDRPIVSGAHPQHLYLGALGAEALRTTGSNCVYVPEHAVGFPKTPIFDGSRLAELFLFFAKDVPPARAYKYGLATICMIVPVLLLLTCWGARVNLPTAMLASSLGLFVWWGPHGRAAIEAGDGEMFLASLAVLCHIGLLVRYDRCPCVLTWLGLAVTGALGLLAQPMLFPVVLPLMLIFYSTAGVRHRFTWHAALFAAEAVAVGVNMFWLPDWFSYWWLRSPFPSASELLPHRTLEAFWNAPIWGGPAHRFLALALFGSGVVGVVIWNETRQRAAARLLGIGAVLLMALALLGISWEPLGQMGTSIFLSPALCFAAIPAAHAWVWLLTSLGRSTAGRFALVAVLGMVGAGGYALHDELAAIANRTIATQPLAIGLDADREALVATLRQYTTPASRILWEDRKPTRHTSRWSVLLPQLTGRSFLGGLDPAGVIEHSSISFIDEALDGRPIGLWNDKALDDYCQRYNVGSIVAWSPAVVERLRNWPGVDKEIAVRDHVAGSLFLLKRPGPGYVSRGQATIVEMNSKHVVLADVVPDNGEVILNLHYVAGLRSAPSRVIVERENVGHDPIGFIRLKTSSPVPRLTLTWER